MAACTKWFAWGYVGGFFAGGGWGPAPRHFFVVYDGRGESHETFHSHYFLRIRTMAGKAKLNGSVEMLARAIQGIFEETQDHTVMLISESEKRLEKTWAAR